MTQDEIIEMAEKVGLVIDGNKSGTDDLQAFANLVAQEVRDRIMFGSRDDWVLAEREACAKVCETMARRTNDIRRAALEMAVENIMARGQA